MENAATCRTTPPVDPALVDGLASYAGIGVKVALTRRGGVGVGNPGHLPLPGTLVQSKHQLTRFQFYASHHVWSRDIDGRPEEIFLCKFQRVPPSDVLQLAVGVQLRVNLDSTFTTTEWNINLEEYSKTIKLSSQRYNENKYNAAKD